MFVKFLTLKTLPRLEKYAVLNNGTRKVKTMTLLSRPTAVEVRVHVQEVILGNPVLL